MEREIVKISDYEIGPILDPDVLDEDEYADLFLPTITGYRRNPEKNEFWDFWDNFEVESEEVFYRDFSKAYEEVDTVVQRLSDKKYFKGRWSRCEYRSNEYPAELIEVFPKDITITIYE